MIKERLETGDYVVSERVAFEFKKDLDYAGSVFGTVDHNLFDQMYKLDEFFDAPNLLIQGIDLVFERYKDDEGPTNGIKGTLRYFKTHYPVNFTLNERETAQFIFDVAVSQQKTNRRGKSRSVKRSKTLNQKREYFIQGLPWVGSVMSKLITEKFSLDQFISLVILTELLETKTGNGKTPKGGYLGIKGLGYKKFREMKEVLTGF